MISYLRLSSAPRSKRFHSVVGGERSSSQRTLVRTKSARSRRSSAFPARGLSLSASQERRLSRIFLSFSCSPLSRVGGSSGGRGAPPACPTWPGAGVPALPLGAVLEKG